MGARGPRPDAGSLHQALRDLRVAQRDASRRHREAVRAFLDLHQAHERGSPGFPEHEQLRLSLERVREQVHGVRQRALEVRRLIPAGRVGRRSRASRAP